MYRKLASCVVVALLVAPDALFAAQYKVDKAHTTVSFKIRHMFNDVAGRFDDFDGSVTFDPEKFADASVEGTIQATSINTNNDKRDTHLRSADFFDVEKHPTITFKSTKMTDVDAAKNTAKLHGVLTMHGVEKPIVLDVAYLGTAKDPWGNTRSGFVGKTKINRKDFGIVWNQTLDAGGLLLGEEVDIEVNVQGMLAE